MKMNLVIPYQKNFQFVQFVFDLKRLRIGGFRLDQGWANILIGGLHHLVMNYQKATSFKIKRI